MPLLCRGKREYSKPLWLVSRHWGCAHGNKGKNGLSSSFSFTLVFSFFTSRADLRFILCDVLFLLSSSCVGIAISTAECLLASYGAAYQLSPTPSCVLFQILLLLLPLNFRPLILREPQARPFFFSFLPPSLSSPLFLPHACLASLLLLPSFPHFVAARGSCCC